MIAFLNHRSGSTSAENDTRARKLSEMDFPKHGESILMLNGTIRSISFTETGEYQNGPSQGLTKTECALKYMVAIFSLFVMARSQSKAPTEKIALF